jgi:hypothetical protein
LEIGINERTAFTLGVAIPLGFKGRNRLAAIGWAKATDLSVFPIGQVVTRMVLGEHPDQFNETIGELLWNTAEGKTT